MEFRLLGSLEASSVATRADLGAPKQRALLAVLLLHVGELVSTELLIELLWGDHPPRTAAHSIQIYVSELRKALEPLAGRAVIVTRAPGYTLQSSPETIDAHRFEQLVRDGTERLASDPREGARLLRGALALWRGPALADFTFEEFAQPYIRRLNDLHIDAIEALATAELETGRPQSVVSMLEAALREDPLRERCAELLMLALYRSGRQAEALRTFRSFRDLLIADLGLEPSPALQALRDRILVHDPSIAPASEAAEIATAEARNPYKGLRPFGEADAADFFGREALVDEVLDALRRGSRLITLVGPSGSGKSSVVMAGLLPRLRSGAVDESDRWVIATMAPGRHPFNELRAAASSVAQPDIGPDVGRPALARPAERRPAFAAFPTDVRVLLVIDQLEEVFTVSDESERSRFLDEVAHAVSSDSAISVVATLRADFYDRPLLHGTFAKAFLPGIVNVLPMTDVELESAVDRPARAVGVPAEPALVARIVSDASEPGALPYLQFALTELFTRRTGTSLSLADYRGLGGLRGVLSRRAEELYSGLGQQEQRVASQLFMRLVRLGQGSGDTRRRLPVRDLADLEADPVAVSAVLGTFAAHRLLTYDRDAVDGRASVAIAHEALIEEWERLRGWIERHRAALRRHEALEAAVDEWQTAGGDPDYLPSGSRLTEFVALRDHGVLDLTRAEREFLAAGLARADAHRTAAERRELEHRRLARSARRRTVALAAALTVLIGIAGLGAAVIAQPRPGSVVLLFHDGGATISGIVARGFDQGISAASLVGRKVDVSPDDSQAALLRLSEDGAGLIIVAALGTDTDALADRYPRTRFATYDPSGEHPNVAWLDFQDHEGAFLAGAAAALTSVSGTIGFVGGVDFDIIWRYEAGYEAGARAAVPGIRIESRYLTQPPDYSGFVDPAAAARAAEQLHRAGADVILAAAGDSGTGILEFASGPAVSAARPLWVIGVDRDLYIALDDLPPSADSRRWRSHVLTSVVKHSGVGASTVITEYARGFFQAGKRSFGLATGGVDIAYSGGQIDRFRSQIEGFRNAIATGEIRVPCLPERLRTSPTSGTGSPC